MFEHRNSGENRRKRSEFFFENLRRAYKDLIRSKKFKIISCLCTFNSGVYLVQVSLLLICQQGLVDFFRYRPLIVVPIVWRIFFRFYANAGGKRPIQRPPLLVQDKDQADPLSSVNNYTPLVISRNDKISSLYY
jgi:hypothetical protein